MTAETSISLRSLLGVLTLAGALLLVAVLPAEARLRRRVQRPDHRLLQEEGQGKGHTPRRFLP
jgi:hypothetical protein